MYSEKTGRPGPAHARSIKINTWSINPRANGALTRLPLLRPNAAARGSGETNHRWRHAARVGECGGSGTKTSESTKKHKRGENPLSISISFRCCPSQRFDPLIPSPLLCLVTISAGYGVGTDLTSLSRMIFGFVDIRIILSLYAQASFWGNIGFIR